MIKLSIVTINWNNGPGLEKTIRSVLSQNYPAIEYIIIDGKSTDSSVTVIESYAPYISYWVSEKDRGLYDAMNKGLQKATGDYVLFLNSADVLSSDSAITNLLEGNNGEDVIYGNIALELNDSLKEVKSNGLVVFSKQYQHDLPPHPAMLIRRTLLNEYNGFDTSYKIIADVVLIAQIFSDKNIRYTYKDLSVTNFDMNGVSSSKQNQHEIYLERKRFLTSSFPQYLPDLERAYSKINTLKKIFNKIRNLFH